MGLVAGEFFFRTFDPQPSFFSVHLDLKTRNRWNPPGGHWFAWGIPKFKGKLVFDDQGLRVPPHTQAVSANAKTAVILGGSISLGWPYNVSFADFLSPYRVINCALPFSNLATISRVLKNQCRSRYKTDPDLLVVQVDLSAMPNPVGFWLMALLYGENLIEDPALLLNKNFYSNIDKYFRDVQFRPTGVPYLNYTDQELMQIKKVIEEPNWLYSHSHFYRLYYNAEQLSARQFEIVTTTILRTWYHWRLKQIPTANVSLNLLKQIRDAVPKSTRVILLLTPDANGMLLSTQRAAFEKYLISMQPSFQAGLEGTWLEPYAHSEMEYLLTFKQRLEEFKLGANALGISIIDPSEALAQIPPEHIYYWDAHHFRPEIQKKFAEMILTTLQSPQSTARSN